MKPEELFKKLWDQYAEVNIQADQIHELLHQRGEKVVNDHIALRTFDLPGFGVDSLAEVFKLMGYEEKGQYTFEQKKLNAKHYELDGYPRVFISELKVSEFSPYLQETVKKLISEISAETRSRKDFLCSGRSWRNLSYSEYQKLLSESEYAAWLAVFGYVANHFTVSVNSLETFKNLQELNTYLKDNGFNLNTSGGEIKGGPEVYLAQSSTLASEVRVKFSDSENLIPCCYYEFAERFSMPGGKLFSGFVEGSADKIFESTDVRK